MPLIAPATGDLEVTVKAHRDHSSGAKLIEWPLPVPHVDVFAPAEVTIIPAENVEINPRSDKLAGLTRSFGVSPSADSSSSSIFYRIEESKARFVADFAVHPQSITVETDSKISLHPRQIDVAQSFIYQIRYEPLDRLVLDVPRKLFDDRKLKFTIGEESVEAYEAAEQPSSDRRSVRISLKQPSLGQVRLDVSYALAEPDLSKANASATDIPLVVSSDGRNSSNAAILAADSGIRIDQREGPWSVVESSNNSPVDPSSLRLTSAEPAEELRLALAIDDRRSKQTTFIDRAWIQSWLTKSVRQDQAVYSLTSDADSLRIKLPRGIQSRDVELALDGKTIVPIGDAAGSLLVNLGESSGRRDHLLALRYQFERQSAETGWLSFELPTFDRHVTVRTTYWQLALPADESLLTGSGNLAPEYVWRWRDYGLGIERVPLKEQPQLEQWIGMSTLNRVSDSAKKTTGAWLDDDLPSRTNRYLFSAVGQEARFEILAVPRWALLFGASLGALFVGLSVMYVPLLRGPRVLIAAAVILLAAVVLWPEQALLLAQAASFGICLAVFSFVLRRALTWSDARDLTPSGPAPSLIERSSQRLPFRSADEAKAATTTASIAVEVSNDGSGVSARGADHSSDQREAGRPKAEPAVGASSASRKSHLT